MKFMKLKRILLTSALLIAAYGSLQAQQTQVIAHRGFWQTPGSAQNSITALVKADSIRCYGSEFDVWLTADNRLVVNHDDIFKGVSSQDATEAVCTAIRLDNGEPMPTLRQYALKSRELSTRLILELKPHRTPEQETRAAEGIVRMIHDYGLDGRVEYISFSLHAVKEFIRLAPAGTPVYYLNGELDPQALKDLGCAGADYEQSVFRQHPEWIEQCHALGMKVNVWTVNRAEDMEWLIEHKVDYITTNEPLLLQQILQKNQK